MNSFSDIDSHTPEEQSQENTKSARLALFIALLALSFTAIGITAGYKHWLRIHVKTKEALIEIATLKEKMKLTADKKMLDDFQSSFKKTTNKEREILEQALIKLEQVSKQTDYAASTVKQQIEALTIQQEQQVDSTTAIQHRLQSPYVAFILQSAQRQLHFLHDKKGTLILLKAADQILIETGSKNNLTLRQHIAKDIATLEHYKPINIEALSTTISQLENEIPPLMALEVDNKTEANTDQGNTAKITDEKNTLTTAITQYFKQSIKLHKTDAAPRQLLSESDKKRIDQLIQLRLESLHLMLLQRHDNAYHWQINRLIKTLNRYYPEQQAKPWINTLESLANVRLNTEPPTLASSKNTSFSNKQE